MYVPPVMAFDFETALTDGTPSTEFYRDDFRAVSCAFAWGGEDGSLKTKYLEGERAIGHFLKRCAILGIPMVAHNVPFEQGVAQCRFPSLSLTYHADTMRLVQVGDNGVPDGFSLQKCARRWLTAECHDHKEPYYEYLRSNCGVKRGKEGSHLHLLPDEMRIAYNVADAKVTLLLYETLSAHFICQFYDWRLDHALYLSSVRLLVAAKIRGVRVDREKAKSAVEAYGAEIAGIESRFLAHFATEIDRVETALKETQLARYKTERGRAKADLSGCVFNIGSTKHLEALFVGQLGLDVKFRTEKGAPAFGKAFLGAWGDGGRMLEKRRSLLIAQKQAETLLEKAAEDGRWHLDLKAVATATGRYGGGGGLNVQGLSRKSKPLMSSLLPDPGNVIVSVDLSAGEPTVTTHYSQDKYYRAAAFDMVGKRPYWDGEVLMIDDIYLMTASVSPLGRDKVRQWWDEGMADKWMADPEAFKSSVKKDRQFHKILCLGLGYGMGPKYMTKTAYQAGFDLDLNTAKSFFKAYWGLFSGVRRLSDRLSAEFKRYGYLVNDFGYRLVPDAEYKALNYMIQSSVSGVMHVLCAKFFAACPWAHFHSVIHDEIVMEVPAERAEEARLIMQAATDSLNEDLGWSVNIRTGWVTGGSYYEAK